MSERDFQAELRTSEALEAQAAHLRREEEHHAQIVHSLRSAGWDRLDAIEEADRLIAKRRST